MTCQLPADCLNEIFEYLAEDKISLRSCLLVNRSWCEVAVRIFWRNIFSIQYYLHHREHIPFATLGTIIACLPSESKDLLYNINGIVVPTPTLNPPIFNYLSFVKVLSICTIGQIIEDALKKQHISSSQSLYFSKYLMLQELFKGFMSQISSLKSLDYVSRLDTQYMPFSYFPGAKDCLKDLSAFSCDSNIYPEFCFQMSQICYNIQSLTIEFKNSVSDGLKDLITFQVDLKYLNLKAFEDKDWREIIPALTKHHNNLTKLHINTDIDSVSFSFIALFENLQELFICSDRYISDFDKLQHVTFQNLRVLKIPNRQPKSEFFTKFLENNGQNLVELVLSDVNKSVKLSISRFCPNLKNLFVLFGKDETNLLKAILDSCQALESIKMWCGHDFLNEKEFLEVIASFSPKNFNELKLYNDTRELFREDMESFLLSWGNRIPHKPLKLFVTTLELNEEIITTIEKYRKLGVIRKFGFENFDY
ncbi:13802_t:CDS:1 [Funneliformis mosseae]|uniref:13802_t:CDS:1 n=1 Tax=Funneliformis mosseae TaxID=27381 RepID=A0A9N9GUM0_FUNMO|nr:13802_t:CDS:1 [Funneliformis mosseae]